MTRTRFLTAIALLLAVGVVGTVGCGGGDGGDPEPPITAPGTPAATLPPASSFAYCLTVLNAMRAAEAPAAPLFTAACASYDTFAQNATDNLITTGTPHQYFDTNNPLAVCPGTTLAAENQGISTDPSDTVALDAIFALFLAEKALVPGDPNRGHYETIVNPALTRVSIGLRRSTDGRFFLTNDFNDAP